MYADLHMRGLMYTNADRQGEVVMTEDTNKVSSVIKIIPVNQLLQMLELYTELHKHHIWLYMNDWEYMLYSMQVL